MNKKLKKRLSLFIAILVAFQIITAAIPPEAKAAARLEDNPSVFGWEDDLDAAIAYMDGSYDLRAGRNARISFGIYNDPAALKWYLEDDYLPMLTTEFERNDCTVKIQNFGNKVTVNGNAFVVAYSRVSVNNHGSKAITLDPKASTKLIRLTSNSTTVAPGDTVHHDYMIVMDKFGKEYAWPTDAELKAAAPDWDTAHTQMTEYWNGRIESTAHFSQMPDDRIRKSMDATFIQFCIINDNGLYAVGENGYDGGGSWKGDQMEMLVYNLEQGNTHALEENMTDSRWYQWNEDAIWWKAGWLWSTYLQKTGNTQFVKEKFINEGSPNDINLERELDFIEECRDPETGIMKASNIDTQGNWTLGDWSALIGLAGVKYICEYMEPMEADTSMKAQYRAWALRAQDIYDSLYEADMKMMSSTMENYGIGYIPAAINQSNEQNRMRNASDANWACQFFAGRWEYEAYLYDAYQGGLEIGREEIPPVMTEVDKTFDYGLGRLVGILPSYSMGGFPGFSSAYNGSYGSGTLRGDRYRSLGIYAYQMLLDNQQSPNGWWETVLYPGATPWEPGVHPISGVGSNPHMWGNTATRYAVEAGFAIQKFIADPAKRDLIIGRGTPREWLMEGKVTELKNYPLAGNEKADIRLEGLAGSKFKVTLDGAAPTGKISLELAALLNNNVSEVAADGQPAALSQVYDGESGKITLSGTTKEIVVTLKDSFPYTYFKAEEAGAYARERLNGNGNSEDVKTIEISGEKMQSGFTKRDSVLNYQVFVEEAGNYAVAADFVNASGSDKKLSVYVNSERSAVEIFPQAAVKSRLTTVLGLREGMNNISYKNDFSDDNTVISFAGISIEKTDEEASGQNLAFGKTVTSNMVLGNPRYITDGYINENKASTVAGQYLQIDLGDIYAVDGIKVYADTTAGITAKFSEDAGFSVTADVTFDAAAKLQTPVRARYVRVSAAGANQWAELQIFGKEAPPQAEPSTANKAIILLEAERADDLSTVTVTGCPEGGSAITDISLNDYILFENVNFGDGNDLFQARAASASNSGGTIEIRVDAIDGPLAGSLSVPDTGSLNLYQTVECSVTGVKGNHDLYLKFTGGGSDASLFNINWVKLFAGGIRSVMVLGPHPDDEILATGGIIRQAVLDNVPIKVVVVLNGGDGSLTQGKNRMQESFNASTLLGVKPEDIIFLGYGDNTLPQMMDAQSSSTVFTSKEGLTTTYGSEQFDTYHKIVTGQEAELSRKNFLGDINLLMATYMPTDVYTTSLYDNHPDHKALYRAVDQALGIAVGENAGYEPTLHRTLVQLPFDMWEWPVREPVDDLNAPMRPFTMPNGFEENTPFKWGDREIVPVPEEMTVLPRNENLKYQAIMKFNTAINQDKTTWLSYVKSDEVFYPQYEFSSDEEGMTNVAAGRSVTSNADGISPEALKKVTDGAFDEYADLGHDQKWVQIDFGRVYSISKVNLWHYYEDSRTYGGVVVQLSNDPGFSSGVTTVFNNDRNNACGQGAGQDQEYAETPSGKKINFDTVEARYLRAWSAGNSNNTANHVVEIQAFTSETDAQYAGSAVAGNGNLTLTFDISFGEVAGEDFEAAISVNGNEPASLSLEGFAYDAAAKKATFTFEPLERLTVDQNVEISAKFRDMPFTAAKFRVPGSIVHEGQNLALGLVPTVSPELNPNDQWQLPFATDGSIENQTDPRPGTDPLGYIDSTSGFTWLAFDLGAEYNLTSIRMWHYYPDQRIYKDVIVQVSDDPTFTSGVTTVFNNDADNSAGFGAGTDAEYAESVDGKTIAFEASGRYVRTSANGSNKNANSHWVEFEVYGTPFEEASRKQYDFNGDGKVDDQDKTEITRYFSKWKMQVTGEQLKAIDINKDGTVDGIDKILVTRFFAGWDH